MPTGSITQLDVILTTVVPLSLTDMKIAHFEKLGRLQRQYHRNNQWRLSPDGLYVPHIYEDTDPNRLSWWDDVGFILNRRRVIVWWQHPRLLYWDEIRDRAYRQIERPAVDDWLIEGSTPNYRKVGRSRKKIVSYLCRQPSPEMQTYYECLREHEENLSLEGIDFEVHASSRRERLDWATGVSLIAPLEVRNEAELALVVDLARRLLLGRTRLEEEFPNYRYGKSDWVAESDRRRPAKIE